MPLCILAGTRATAEGCVAAAGAARGLGETEEDALRACGERYIEMASKPHWRLLFTKRIGKPVHGRSLWWMEIGTEKPACPRSTEAKEHDAC